MTCWRKATQLFEKFEQLGKSSLLEKFEQAALKPQLLFAPLLHGEEDGHEALALGSEGVFHAWRHLAEVGTRKKAVSHQFSELLTVARRCTVRSKLDDGMKRPRWRNTRR